MIIDKTGTTTVITQEKATITELVSRLTETYAKYEQDNIIVNLFSLHTVTAQDLNEFLLLSRKHKANKHSFVIVNKSLSYSDVEEEISITPTLQEAHDLIEMEEIERDLEL